MRKILVVVDMQNDFIDGALGSAEALGIVEGVGKRIEESGCEVIFTRDTHGADYSESSEGLWLPVPHCIKGMHGWQISSALPIPEGALLIDKDNFGSVELMEYLIRENAREHIDEVELVGLCTDICVISNAMLLRAALTDSTVTVNSALCRGVSEESHNTALSAMRACRIEVI